LTTTFYMPESVFHFKQFKIDQDRCAMKVGTDGVLLGSWIKLYTEEKILDVGTGTGLIAIMLAQRSHAQIDAIDIDKGAYDQALENCAKSPWADKLKVVHASLQDYRPGYRYDLIVSNPPYFIDSFAPSDEARNRARQASATLSYDELLNGVVRLLNVSGRFCIILPEKEGKLFSEKAQQNGLFCNCITGVRTKPHKPFKRLMMEFSRIEEELIESEIVINNEDGSFTDEYKMLTQDYYPRFNQYR
jgi:tRNA1Val (adenine37-N6)-methyltransferase